MHVFVHVCECSACVRACMHVCVRMFVYACVCVCVCRLVGCVCVIICVWFPQFQSFSQLLLSASFYIVTKTVCPSVCPERCFDYESQMFCCNTKCAAGCSGGVTESDCVVSMKGVE